jgi:hypothetical protein
MKFTCANSASSVTIGGGGGGGKNVVITRGEDPTMLNDVKMF